MNDDKKPTIEVGPLITSIEISEGTAKEGVTYQRTWYRPFYFSNEPEPDLDGESYRYTNVYNGELYIHTINATPLGQRDGSPYPSFQTAFDPDRPDRLVSANDVRFEDVDIKLSDADPIKQGGASDVIRTSPTNDTGLSFDEIASGTIQSPDQGSGVKKETKFGPNSPGTGVFSPDRPSSGDNKSSYDKERAASERTEQAEGKGTNPFFNRDGFILLPSWFQWLTWPLAILADALFDGFGLTTGFKNILLLIILGLVIFAIYKYSSKNRNENVSMSNNTAPKGVEVSASVSPDVARALALGLI